MSAPTTPFLPEIAESTLLVVDLQERLLPAMWPEDRPGLIKQSNNLIEAFRHFGGRIVYSEQYPRGLGATVPELAGALAGRQRVEKVDFSVLAAPAFAEVRDSFARDVVLAGIEAHVCVLQTGRDLLAAGHRVWVAFDAVASRFPRYRDNGLALLERAGAVVINTESLIFAELERAGGDAFKHFSKLIK